MLGSVSNRAVKKAITIPLGNPSPSGGAGVGTKLKLFQKICPATPAAMNKETPLPRPHPFWRSSSNNMIVIPANNKGRKSLATIYWLLAQQVVRERGELSSEETLSVPIEDFETKLLESSEEVFE